MRYDWSRVSRAALENLASAVQAWAGPNEAAIRGWNAEGHAFSLALHQARQEAELPEPRTQAEVDAQIASKFREYMTGPEEASRDSALWHELEDLVLEPVAELTPLQKILRGEPSGVEEPEGGIMAFSPELSPMSPRELLSQPVNETPESLQLLVKAAFVHRQGEGVQYTPAHAPTLAQVKAWDPSTFQEVARWARLEHALAHPIAGQDYPEREPLPRAVADLVVQNDATLKAAEGKPPKKKRQRSGKAGAK